MSNKLEQDFDIFYAELRNFTESFKSKSQAVQIDEMFSDAGKHAKSAELKVEHIKNINDLGQRFQTDFGKRVSNIGRTINGEKTDAVLDSIKKRFSKGESVSSDETTRLLLHEMGENKTLMRKSNFQNMLSNADEKQLRKTAQSLNDSKDIERLEWLREMSALRGDDSFSSTIQAQVDGIRDASLSDEQKNLKKTSERIQKGVKLFQYSLERSKTGEFVDARNEEV